MKRIYNDKKAKLFLITTILFLFCCTVLGQISTDEKPISFNMDVPDIKLNEKNYKVMPPLDMDKINKEDEDDKASGRPPRFGYRHKVNYDLENSGEWVDLEEGGKIWRLVISCPEALSINLLYDKFWLPDGAKFFIYSNREHSIGAFTSINNKGDRENIRGFATGLVYGNQITLEYYLPAGINDRGTISIAYVVHGYRYIKAYGTSDTCHININCPAGQNWQNEKNAVALTLVNGNRWSSGSLVNTTANDARPLFLTAEHCLIDDDYMYDAENDSILDHWSFYWHYESPECISTFEPPHISTSGAILIANNTTSDFALLRLEEDPRNHSKVTPYYLGWDRSGNAVSNAVGIHHPDRDIKKISLTNQVISTSSYIGLWGFYHFSPNMLWEVVWSSGVTAQGSSGSPLINNNRKVIGQLAGGGSFCYAQNAPDYYGKFNISWDYNSNIKRQLKHWLDPIGTGVTVLDGCGQVINFVNKTVSTNQTVTNKCGDIKVQNVKVQNKAKLTIDATGEVNIDGPFEVELGSELEIK